jgi:pilus assembly protein CpaF
MSLFEKIAKIQEQIHGLQEVDFSQPISQEEQIQNVITTSVVDLDPKLQRRVLEEFTGHGPLASLISDTEISEVIVNGFDSIWFEKGGKLLPHLDRFASPQSYSQFLARFCHQAQVHCTLERPMTDGQFLDFRLHLISEELTRAEPALSLRRHPVNAWTLSRLQEIGWASESGIEELRRMIHRQENFLVVGTTGSGKTSVASALLGELKENERVIIIEDTSELQCPNTISTKLLTRKETHSSLCEINQAELLKQSLRMRPDRLVLGEVRGSEAKDLLMALSTGHAGSFATLHASDPHQALLRLEMLIQLGAPFWSLDAIRNLIFLSLQKIVIVEKTTAGQRRLSGIYSLSSRESSGILIDRAH